MDNYLKFELLGEGTYGKVYNCFNTKNNKYYAMKEIDVSDFDDFLELDFLSKFSHPNIINLEEFYFINESVKKYKLILILEKCRFNLKNYFENGYILNSSKKTELMFKLLSSLNFIHSQNYCYGDLKPTNILLNDNLDVKLCDFGLTQPLENKIEFSGSTLFTSPQGLVANLKPNPSTYPIFYEKLDPKSADLFALGINFYYIYTDGKMLLLEFLKDKNHNNIDFINCYIEFIKNYETYLRLHIKDSNFCDLLCKLINPSQHKRFETTLQVLDHPFFKMNNYHKFINGYEFEISLKNSYNVDSKLLLKKLYIIRQFASKYKFNELFCYTAFYLYFRCFYLDSDHLIYAVIYLANTIIYQKFNVVEFKDIFNIKNYSYNFCPYCGLKVKNKKCCDSYTRFNFEDLLIQILYLVKGNIRVKNMYEHVKDKINLSRGLNLIYQNKNLKISPKNLKEKYKLI
jgi:hypothetical protein